MKFFNNFFILFFIYNISYVSVSNAKERFPVSKNLRPAIDFWKDIFSDVSSDMIVLHDRYDLSLVWKKIPLPKNKKGVVNEDIQKEFTRKAIQDLRKKMVAFTKNKTFHATDEELNLFSQNKKRLRVLSKNIRAQRGMLDVFSEGIKRGKKWIPQIKKILIQYELPVELALLPLIESSYRPYVKSSAKAAGLWQLMPLSAKEQGLKVNKHKDERLDIIKSTQAASKILRFNYRGLKSWPLAITAYNHGFYGIKRAIKKMKTKDIHYLIKYYKKRTWGFASKNFYVEFIAVLELFSDTLKDSQENVTKEKKQ